jgi:hypothetical protein
MPIFISLPLLPDRQGVQPLFLSSGYQNFLPGVKRPERDVNRLSLRGSLSLQQSAGSQRVVVFMASTDSFLVTGIEIDRKLT